MDPLVTQAKSSGISALLGAAGIGVQYTPINEFTKMAIGVVILFTLVIRAAIAVVELKKALNGKEKEKDSKHE
jgi:hypothetical protein